MSDVCPLLPTFRSDRTIETLIWHRRNRSDVWNVSWGLWDGDVKTRLADVSLPALWKRFSHRPRPEKVEIWITSTGWPLTSPPAHTQSGILNIFSSTFPTAPVAINVKGVSVKRGEKKKRNCTEIHTFYLKLFDLQLDQLFLWMSSCLSAFVTMLLTLPSWLCITNWLVRKNQKTRVLEIKR